MSHSGTQLFNIFLIFVFVLRAEGLNELQTSSLTKNIAGDYYWQNTVLRAQKLTCDTNILQVICQARCGDDYNCIEDKCYCKSKSVKKKFLERAWTKIKKLLNQRDNNRYITNKVAEVSNALRTAEQEVRPDYDEEVLERPVLRHHIAHFCPSLNEAKKCIRECMKAGKPTFCGKDHVCYCGHRYTSHDQNKPRNQNDMYANFRDLYEKFFGPQSGESVTHDEHEGNEDYQ